MGREEGETSWDFAALCMRGLRLGQRPPRRELLFPCLFQVPGCAELLGQSSERCQAEGSLGQATGVVVRSLALRTRAPTTGLLRATPGNFLKEDGARFGFSVHFYHLNKATKGVGMLRTRLWCPATCPSQKWGHLAEPQPNHRPGLLSLLGVLSPPQNLLRWSSLLACRWEGASSRPRLLSQTVGLGVGLGRWNWICGCQSSLRERQD